MKRMNILINILALAFAGLLPGAIMAQETKKEVHIKVVENGIVTKDTVYNITGDMPDPEILPEFKGHCKDMHPVHMKEMHEFIIEDSIVNGSEESVRCIEMQHMHMHDSTANRQKMILENAGNKDIKVIVRTPDHQRHPDIEEIWLEGPGDGSPCRTIIIHEGDCPGKDLEKDIDVIIKDEQDVEPSQPVAPAPPQQGEKPAPVKRKVVKSDGGKKVMIIEYTEDTEKGDKK